MEKKYKLTSETIEHNGVTLHRIEAIIDFGFVRAGSKGGWVESEYNLSHDGDCWIYDEAKVYGRAKVYGDAKITDYAQVYDHAEVYHCAVVEYKAQVFGYAHVYGAAHISCQAKIYGSTNVFDEAKVSGKAHVCGYATVKARCIIYDDVKICGSAVIDVNLRFNRDTVITDNSDYIVFKNYWSSGRLFMYTKSNKMWSVGCFHGTGEELIKKAYEDDKLNGVMYEKYIQFVEQLEQLGI